MAPRDTPKASPKVQRAVTKTNVKNRLYIKKTMSNIKSTEKIPLKVNNTGLETRTRTNAAPAPATPKPKENKPAPAPGSVTKSVKKSTWKRRPKPAHSGVPVPEKMKKLMQKQLMDSDCSF